MQATLMKPRARVTWNAEERAEWLRLYRESGQTAAEFAKDNDLSAATLSFWCQQSLEPPLSESALVEIPRETLNAAAAVVSSTAIVTVQLPSGLRFEVPVGVDMAWFGRLLQVLVDTRGL